MMYFCSTVSTAPKGDEKRMAGQTNRIMQEHTEQHLVELLQARNIKPTAMRLLVLRCLTEASETLTLRQMEEILYPADRSTIFRTLTLFEQQHLLHTIDDGSGSARYEICLSHHDDDDDRHPHFRCLRCGRTICLFGQRIPEVELPEGYQAQQTNYVITGLCPECSVRDSHTA